MLSGCGDRGVSDTIGFVFVFALIVSSVGIVSVVGVGSLQDARDNERVTNAERAFEVLSENVEDLRRDGTPSRATEIKLGGASIRTGDPITVNVTASGGTDNASTGNVSVTPIVYEAQTGEQIRYVNGAIVRSNDDARWLVREPRMVIGQERTMIPILRLRADSQRSIGGEQTVHVRTIRETTDVAIADSDDAYDNVTIRTETPNVDAWQEYYESQGMDCDTPAENVLECESTDDPDRVYVTIVRVTVEFA